MTLRGYMDVITRTTLHLQARKRCETDDQAETGSESELDPGRNQPRIIVVLFIRTTHDALLHSAL